ncbi:MAG: guanylate kinase [bacterium]|nr:guanylate kinase [bacterium]
MRGREGILFVISAPSGTGKSTLARRLVDETPELEFSVSFTTRAPREGEVDGSAYHFVDAAAFEAMIAREAFLEWANVFDNRYGTGIETTRESLDAGGDLLLDIDVQGARQVRGGPIPATTVMVLPPDFPTLERRLSGRGSEDEAQLRRRLGRARDEAEDYDNFDYLVVNDDLETAYSELQAIVRAERRRAIRCRGEARRIIETFPA